MPRFSDTFKFNFKTIYKIYEDKKLCLKATKQILF
jgi:hypothetical protein